MLTALNKCPSDHLECSPRKRRRIGQCHSALKRKLHPLHQSEARDQAKTCFNIVSSSHFYLMVTHLLRPNMIWKIFSLYREGLSAFLNSHFLLILKTVLSPTTSITYQSNSILCAFFFFEVPQRLTCPSSLIKRWLFPSIPETCWMKRSRTPKCLEHVSSHLN